MKLNNLEIFLEKMKSGKTAFGTCITFHDSSMTELAADAGFDFCWIDWEHGVMSQPDIMHHIMALKGTSCAPLVRVPWNEHGVIKKVIDLAPAGIIVPMVNTAEDAATAVSACRYPEAGTRGCGFRRAIHFGADSVEEYLEVSRKEPLVIVQIEHYEAVKNLESILSVPGVGSICIGPYDLSASVGKAGRLRDPEVVALIDEICGKTREAGVLLGAFGSDLPFWKSRGVNWLSTGNDSDALFRSYRAILASANAD